MSVLVVCELKGDSLKKISREMVSAGKSLGDSVTALMFGGNDDQAKELFEAGADVVVKSGVTYSPEGVANITPRLRKLLAEAPVR